MKKCVLLVCTKSYMDFAARLVEQIRKVESFEYDVLIASTSPLSEIAVRTDAKHLLIEVDEFIRALPVSERLKHFAYWRIPAIEKAAQIYDRILYLDIDIFCAGPGINDLLEIPMKNKSLAAIMDVHLHYRPKRIIPEYRAYGSEHAGYFNAGVLLIDGPLWLKEKRFEQIKRFCKKNPNILSRLDQSALNMVFYKDWLELSPVWNWQYSKRNAYISVHAGPRLVHYVGDSKIWDVVSHGVIRSHWLLFNHGLLSEQNEQKEMIAEMNWQYLWSSIWYRKSFLKYFKRFSNDFTTLIH